MAAAIMPGGVSGITCRMGRGGDHMPDGPWRGSHAGWTALVSLFSGPRRHVDRRKGDTNAHPPEEAVPAEPGGPVVVAVRAGRGLFVRGDRDHRRILAALLQAEHGAGQ